MATRVGSSGIETPAATQDWEGTALGTLREWIATSHKAYAVRQDVAPREFDVTPLADLMRRRPDLPFDEATVETYLENMQRVEAIEAGTRPSGLWVLLHGAVDPLPSREVGDEQAYTVVTLFGRTVAKAAQVAVAPMIFDDETRLWVPQEHVLVSTGTELHGPPANFEDQLAVLALAQAVYDVLPKHQ